MPSNSADQVITTTNVIARHKKNGVPDLNPSVPLDLKNKIEINLKHPKPESSIQKNPPKILRKQQEKLPNSNRVPSASDLHHTNIVGQGKDQTRRVTPPSALTLIQQQKKKRPRDRKLKEPGDARTDGNSFISGPKTIGRNSNKQSDLEKEVIALGGTENDFQLIADAPSDSEIETQDPGTENGLDSRLGKDLLRLVQGLEVDEKETRYPSFSSKPGTKHTDQIRNKKVEIQHSTNIITTNKSALKAQTEASGHKGLPHLHFEPRPDWHCATLPKIPIQNQENMINNSGTISRIHEYAISLLELENKNYASRNQSGSSAHHFYSTIMSSGTLSDKISALTLSVQESPVHNMKALENLVGLARKRSRGQAVEALGALKDLLGSGALLPSDRKLRIFASQPGLYAVFNSHKTWLPENPLPDCLTKAHLISWAYENWLKSMYFDILKILESWCNDEVVFARIKAIDYVYHLLKEKPEQEANLLRLLVNKLGDSDKKIASRTSHNILQLETTHPLMKLTIVTAIESDLLFKSGQSLHAKYYAIITLNQTVLSGKEADTAKKLLLIYFSLFLKLLEHPKDVKTTIDIPKMGSTTLNKKGEVQGGGGVLGKKSLRKAAVDEKVTNSDDDLREKMLSAVLTGVNRAIPFAQIDNDTFEKHLDTLYRVTHSSNFNTSIQALMLIQQLHASHQGSNDRFYRTLYESLLDPRILTSSKQALYLNLLFKALRSDLNIRRVKAFSKRLLQVIATHQASFACGALYLLRELESVFKSLPAFVDEPSFDDSDEENFQDVQDIQGGTASFQVHAGHQLDHIRNTSNRSAHIYDGRKRDPEYSNADRSCLWELTPLLMHFHPSVALFASKLMNHEPMPPKPDLSLHTLIHFLDRFVYKNSKVSSGPRGSSIMQPVARTKASGLLVSTQAKSLSKEPVNTEGFWKQERGKVDVNEVFFHRYFNTMGKGKERAKKKKGDRKGEADADNEEDGDEDEIWKALVDSRHELEGDILSDDNVDLDNVNSDNDDAEEDMSVSWNDDASLEGRRTGLQQAELEDGMELEDDEEALFDSDDDIPSDVDQALVENIQVGSKEVQAHEMGKHNRKRRKLKNLPTFAAADDYAAMLSDGD